METINRIRVKQKLLRQLTRASTSSSSRLGSHKSFKLTIPWSLAKPVKTFLWIIVHRHLTIQKQMGLLREQCAEFSKGLVLYCCNQVWMKKWWAVSMGCYCFKILDLSSDGKTLYERRFGEPFKGPVVPCGSMVEYEPISTKDQSRIHQFGRKVLPGIFLGYALYAGWIWKSDIMVADIEELDMMDPSEIYSKRLNTKEVITPKKMVNSSYSRSQMEKVKLSGEDQDLTENIHLDSGWRVATYFKTDFRMPEKHEMISGPFRETSFTDITLGRESKLHTPREETLPIPLKHVYVTRATHTTLDVMQESRIDVYWNIDGSWDLSDSWSGFTQFTLLKEKPPEGKMWSGRRLTKRQATSRPDYLWPEIWKDMSKNSKLKEMQNWAIEKPKLDNERRLRGIYFNDPEDIGFKETIKNARRKLEVPIARAMPCKKDNWHGKPFAQKTVESLNLHASWKPVNPQECVWREFCLKFMKTILQGKGVIHYIITIWCTKFNPMPQAMKIPAAKAAVDKAWEKFEKIPA